MSGFRIPTACLDASDPPPGAPFYMITRDYNTDDVTAIEREIAAELGITDFDDHGFGLLLNRYGDARLIAQAMAARLDRAFGVVKSSDDPIMLLYIAFGPSERRLSFVEAER